MTKYKVKKEYEVSDTREIALEWNGNSYLIIYGKHVNGGFFCIPNQNCGGELAGFSDTFWNSESISSALGDDMAGSVIAEAIAEIEMY